MMKLNRLNILPLLLCLSVLGSPGCNLSKQKQSKKGLSNLPPIPYPGPEKFADHIRTTGFQTPAQEQTGFKLPPGFEITLYAAEPDIGKPINMDFDEKGRLWVTQSSEYPMAAAPMNGHDRITILEDTDGDGRADKFTPFATELNIPIGIIPVQQGVIAFSIPNIYRFTDKDGDGRSDDRKVILGEFGYQDTHGMVNNFIRGFDGWIYACHGFTNTSVVAGTDRDSVKMVSGNTFRFREDGSRVEQTSYGRVNPFGYTFDEWGYLYSVDCHSKPIYQLIRGGEYPHFGKKTPAMGYAPEMMSYELGSTALSGLDYYMGEQFPEAYRNCFYNGDVVTCRINRNTMSFSGSSPEAQRQEDFLISADPWFRPVSIKEGPDGALYVADFYNRIIGHYEVPLNHPLRDRQSGRIWRIAYVGDQKHKNRKPKDWADASLKDLIGNLNYPQLNIRMAIANQLIQRYGKSAVDPLRKLAGSVVADGKARVQALWALYRLDALEETLLDKALRDSNALVRVHTCRILSEQNQVSSTQKAQVLGALSDPNVHVRRVAAEVLGKNPDAVSVPALLELYNSALSTDTHLKYTVLLALRDHLRNQQVMQKISVHDWQPAQASVLMKVIRDVPSSGAAGFAMKYLEKHEVPNSELLASLEYIGRYIGSEQIGRSITYIRQKFAGDGNAQYQLYTTIEQGLRQRGAAQAPAMREWGISLAESTLKGLQAGPEEHQFIDPVSVWYNRPLADTGDPENPWEVIDRQIVGELPRLKVIWSEHNWYAPMGTLVSPVFKLPSSLEISIFDNDVHNTEQKTGVSKNTVRIRLAKSGQVIAEYRSAFEKPMKMEDLMKQIPFDLRTYTGQAGYIEITDSTKTGSVGIGGLKPEVLSLPDAGLAEQTERYTRAAEIAGIYRVNTLEPALKKLLLTQRTDYRIRAAAASALLSINAARNSRLVEDILTNLNESQLIKEKMAQVLGQSSSTNRFTALQKGLAGSQRSLQLTIAPIMAGSGQGIGLLLQSVQKGEVPFDLLSEVAVKERLNMNIEPGQRKILEQLSAGRASESEARKQLIEARLSSFDPGSVTVEEGRMIFMQNCSMCHQIKGNGGMIGPQLDGIGNWGQKALTEKILDPNRNISQAFRTYNIILKDGRTLSGLYRREEGEVLVFANPGGQEFTVAKADIKQRTPSKYTLMPDQFRNTIARKDFDALLKFLLATKE